ncbi:MAG: hypothetical protein HN566_12750 [Polaribacter sp.]|nr:hypothetical protein [Polaribacter sp.]
MKIIKIEEVKLYRVYVSEEDISEAKFEEIKKTIESDFDGDFSSWAYEEVNGYYNFELKNEKDLGSDEKFLVAKQSNSDDEIYGEIVLGEEY